MPSYVCHPPQLPLGEGDVEGWDGQGGVVAGAGEALPVGLPGGVAGFAEVEAARLVGEGLEGVVGGDVPTQWVGGGPRRRVPDGQLARQGDGTQPTVSKPIPKRPFLVYGTTSLASLKATGVRGAGGVGGCADLRLHRLLDEGRAAEGTHSGDDADGAAIDEEHDIVPTPHERVVVVPLARVKPQVELQTKGMEASQPFTHIYSPAFLTRKREAAGLTPSSCVFVPTPCA